MNKDRCRIANAYIQSGRIANPTEQRSTGETTDREIPACHAAPS